MDQLFPNEPSAECVSQVVEGSQQLSEQLSNESSPLNLLDYAMVSVTLSQGQLVIVLRRKPLLELLRLRIEPSLPHSSQHHVGETITISSAFEHRKRGVESKLILGANTSTKLDHVLIMNIAKARGWLASVKSGVAIKEIAANEGRSIKQIQRYLELSFLSPRIVKLITEGTQPAELTTRQLVNTIIPMDWKQQHRQFGIE